MGRSIRHYVSYCLLTVYAIFCTLSVMPPTAALRERKKHRTRDALIASAYRLFQKQGFNATTVEEIVGPVEVSPRTFFRYFETKEAVVFPERAALVARFRTLLMPQRLRESPYAAVRRAFLSLAQDYMRDRETVVTQYHIVQASPELVAHELKLDMDIEEAIAEALLVGASGNPDAERQARIWAGATLGLVRATLREWFATDGRADLASLGAASFDLLERGIPHEAETRSAHDGRLQGH